MSTGLTTDTFPSALVPRCLYVSLVAAIALAVAQRGVSQETAAPSYLGENILWRCREGLVFHLAANDDTPFSLTVALRDMNTYQQGPRPALVWLIGPDGTTVARHILPDDGDIDGDPETCDGVADVYMDLRYREWHRANSPRGVPPGKQRTAWLTRPQDLPARTIDLEVSDGAAGLYRLVVVAGWDFWVSVTPSRPLPAGIHPGPGPLYVHGNRLAPAYLYLPANVEDISVALTEEVTPFSWRVRATDEDGTVLGTTTPESRISYLVLKKMEGDSVLKLDVFGNQPGACLHLTGVPFLLCPDADTARLLHGGAQLDRYGRATFHAFQRTLTGWAYALNREDLTLTVRPHDGTRPLPGQDRVPDSRKLRLQDVPRLLESQDLNPASETYGRMLKTGKADLDDKVNWRTLPALLGNLAAFADDDNPYHAHPALLRRLALERIMSHVLSQAPYFWYGHNENARTIPAESDNLWDVGLRSNWYPMHDGRGALLPGAMTWDMIAKALPRTCIDAWQESLVSWAVCRSVMQQGECSNQWAAGLRVVKDAWLQTGADAIEDILEFQTTRFTTPGNLGRVNPDRTPFDGKSKVSYAGRAADAGLIGGWVASDGLGHDNEYCLESTLHMANIWERLPHQGIERWLEQYYKLKTHLTMPKEGGWPRDVFSGTCSPTDFNHRTCCYTHKSPLGNLRPHIPYGDIWAGDRNEAMPWPCLEKGSFVRVIDNQYYFVKTPAYYAILYAGPANPPYASWTQAQVGNGHASLVGYGGMHYTGTQRKATKIGGLSAVWVPTCGPVWLAQNLNVMMSNTVWGRRQDPICDQWEQGHVDPRIVCSGFATPDCEWDPKAKRMIKTERFEHAPLTVRRDIVFREQGIEIDVSVEAEDDLSMNSLHESLPFYASQRTITLYDPDGNATILDMPEPLTSSRVWQSKAKPGNPHYSEDPDSPRMTITGYSVQGDTGAGAALLFQNPQRVTRTRPLKYRSVAGATASINVDLPTKLDRGQSSTIRYAIIPFETPPTRDELAAWRRALKRNP